MTFLSDPVTLASLLVAATVVLVVEACYLGFAQASSYRKQVNRRLVLGAKETSREAVLIALRRERGLTEDGRYATPAVWLNKLVLQSGVSIGLPKLAIMASAFGTMMGVAAFITTQADMLAVLAATVFGTFVFPVLVLMFLRSRRRNAFGARFPDAVDIIVRSIRAGHPVPIAIGMVARELPDPVGTEFGMVADEVTYGADLEGAMRNLLQRVGQEDLPLFVTAVAIQNSTGGNLAEILSNLSKVIRERFKMRRKIKALSSEGRFSALALSALPLIVLLLVNASSPNYYTEVWHIPTTKTVLACAAAWMMVGNMVMMKMVNFKI